MTTEDKAPSGELILMDYFHETASTHYDESRKVTLRPTDNYDLLLEEYSDSNNQYRMGSNNETKAKWVISRDRLIGFIKEHGKPVR